MTCRGHRPLLNRLHPPLLPVWSQIHEREHFYSKVRLFWWFYLHGNHFSFWSPQGDEQVSVIFRIICKSRFLDFLSNVGFLLTKPTFLICSYCLSYRLVQLEQRCAPFSQYSGKKCAHNRKSPLLWTRRSKSTNLISKIPISFPRTPLQESGGDS